MPGTDRVSEPVQDLRRQQPHLRRPGRRGSRRPPVSGPVLEGLRATVFGDLGAHGSSPSAPPRAAPGSGCLPATIADQAVDRASQQLRIAAVRPAAALLRSLDGPRPAPGLRHACPAPSVERRNPALIHARGPEQRSESEQGSRCRCRTRGVFPPIDGSSDTAHLPFGHVKPRASELLRHVSGHRGCDEDLARRERPARRGVPVGRRRAQRTRRRG